MVETKVKKSKPKKDMKESTRQRLDAIVEENKAIHAEALDRFKVPTGESRAVGRPTKYNLDLAATICDRVATHSVGIRAICAMYDDMPAVQNINLWRVKHLEFRALYREAKALQAELLAEDVLEIADDSSKDRVVDEKGKETLDAEFVARSRLRIDARKWIAAKLAPKYYGEKIQNEVTIVKHEDSLKDLE